MARAAQGTLIDQLRRDTVHARDIGTVLESLRQRLGDEGIPFALIGALALRYHGYVRFTEDIDILTTREGLDRIHSSLVGRGLATRAAGLRKSLRETEHQVDIDVVTAGEHAGSPESPVEYPAPDSGTFVEVEGLRVPTLEALVSFKIASGVWGHRMRDLADVQSLIRANGLTEEFSDRLSPPLRETFLNLERESRLERRLE
jgi:Nucleotidyl transferase AbiEii toxin, Type IV TA system